MQAEEEDIVRGIVEAIEAERERYVDFLRRRVGSDAEDIYQQSLLRTLEQAGTIRNLSHVRAWFWRVVRNAVADHHAARVARDARYAAFAASDETTSHEARAACACALGLLAQLPPSYAEILRRVDLDDERLGDVAHDLGIRVDNATVRLHRARKALREKLSGCCQMTSMRACFSCDCPDEAHAAWGNRPRVSASQKCFNF